MESEDCEVYSPIPSDDEGFTEVPFRSSRTIFRGKPSSGTARSATVTFAPNTPHQAPVSGPSASAAASRQNIKVPPTPVELPQTTPSILNLALSNTLPPEFLTANMILTIKLPPRQPSEPKRIIIIEINNTLFNTIINTLKIIAPSSIIASAWSLGLLLGIGPPPPTKEINELTQYIYQIIFRWPPSADITLSQVQEIITTSTSAQPHSTIIPTRSRRSDQPPSTFADTPLLCSLIFSRDITSAAPFSLKVKSFALTYQFTVALHDNCSDKRIHEVLISIMSTITDKQASLSDTEKFFQRVIPIHKDNTSAPRISNNWRHLATFQRIPGAECQQLFQRLMTIHKQHRAKLLLPSSDLSARLKNASFSFFNEMKQSKIKTNTNLIDWMVTAFNTFATHNPLSLQTETESESSGSDKPRDPQNPWKPLTNLIPPGMPPLFQHYNEAVHQYQAEKAAHLKQAKIFYSPSLTSLSPLHSTPLSISFTKTIENTVYTVEGPMLFTRYDFGQLTTIEERKVGNTCLLLCLAAATKLNPADLSTYFTSRTKMLSEANLLYDKHEELRDDWANFCHPSSPPNFSHLASNFPRTQKDDWAGSFTLGTSIALNHISTLAPTEICNCSILFITDDPSDNDNHDIHIDISDVPNRLAYFPPRDIIEGTTPISIIILHRHNHYTLLSPLTSQHDAIGQILTFLGASAAARHHPYIPLQYSHDIPNIAHLVGLSSLCTDTDTLDTAHRLLHKDIYDHFGRSLPGSQLDAPLHDTFNPAFEAADDPFTPSPAPGNKHHRRMDDLSSSEAAQQAPRPRDSQSPVVIVISSMSLSSSSPPSERGNTPTYCHPHTPFDLSDFGSNGGNLQPSSSSSPPSERENTPVHRYPPTPSHPSDLGTTCGDAQPSLDDPSSPENLSSPSQSGTSASSTTDPPPWPIERIIRCAPVDVTERPCPLSPTNARNLTYLVHRKHLTNIWVPYNTIRNTTECDHFIRSFPEITGHVYLNSPPPPINSQTDTNSITSSTNLGDLVFPLNSESRFHFQIGVRGDASSDTTSLSGSYDQSAIASPSTSVQPSILSTGSFHPHAADTSHPTYRLPQCSNPMCASMTFGCFHQDNHACDICFRTILFAEYGYHCPHCDRDYCVTCHPIHWTPISSIPSTQADPSLPTTQEILSVEIDPSPPLPSSSHNARAPHTVASHSRVGPKD